MSARSTRLWSYIIALSLLAVTTFGPNAAARNIIEGFSRPPTFTPPAGCVPLEETYGVLSRCEKTIEPGRALIVLIDTAAGAGATSEWFVADQVADIKAYWQERENVTFSSRTSDIVPSDAPQLTKCMEYSIAVQTKEVMRVEGLTCAWIADPSSHSGHGNWTNEIFWLEAYDEYNPSIGQKPMKSFDLIVRKVFESARLLAPPP